MRRAQGVGRGAGRRAWTYPGNLAVDDDLRILVDGTDVLDGAGKVVAGEDDEVRRLGVEHALHEVGRVELVARALQ